MIKLTSAALVVLSASGLAAEETRQLDAHEHGVGQLDIAFDGTQIAMELHAPGADIVGFEYAATSVEDRAKIDDAVALLARPLDLYSFPDEATCTVVQASAALESEEGHDDHADHKEGGHGEDGHKEDGHDDHAAHTKGGHKDEAHAAHDDEHAHDEGHKHDEEHGHDKVAHKEEGHDDHASEAAGHTEFHATYLLDCAVPTQATSISFGYFDAFPNAIQLEVQVISDKGATAFEVMRDAPTLDLRDMF